MNSTENADTLPTLLEREWTNFARSLRRRGKSDQTAALYRRSFVRFWTWALDAGLEADPGAITRRDVNAYSDHLLECPAIRNGAIEMTTDDDGHEAPKLLAPSTRRILWRNLRPFFGWYAKELDIDSPFQRADPPGDDRPTPIPLIPDHEIDALLEACSGRHSDDLRDTAIVHVLIACGPRRGEVAAMKVDDWNNDADMLTFTGKTGTRLVPATLATAEALASWERARRMHDDAHLPWLWLGRKGRLGDSGISTMLKRRCKQADIEPINPHRFRHTWAHNFRAAGGQEGDLTYLAGWTSTQMAHRYGRSGAAARAQAIAREIGKDSRL